jgi:hypothetical protein
VEWLTVNVVQFHFGIGTWLAIAKQISLDSCRLQSAEKIGLAMEDGKDN